MMGADYYGFFRWGKESDEDLFLGLGRDCDIEGAIIDKNAKVGRGTVIRPFPQEEEMDSELYCVRDGIVVIPKGTVIPPYTRIAPD